MTVHLTLRQVQLAGREAYLAGTLQAVHGDEVCYYRDAVGHPCVVGAAVSDAVAKHWDTLGSVQTLILEDELATDDGEELMLLQTVHDYAVRYRSRPQVAWEFEAQGGPVLPGGLLHLLLGLEPTPA